MLQRGYAYLFPVDELWRVAYERATARTNLEDIMAVGIEWKRLEAEVHVNVTVSSKSFAAHDRVPSRTVGQPVY